MLLGDYIIKHYRGHYYAKAQNLVAHSCAPPTTTRWRKYDLLLMPTVPMTRHEAARRRTRRWPEILARAFEMLPNTAPFDVTGHPAMSLPCGMVDGLPVGLMLIGKHYDEATIYRAAHAFEQSGRLEDLLIWSCSPATCFGNIITAPLSDVDLLDRRQLVKTSV